LWTRLAVTQGNNADPEAFGEAQQFRVNFVQQQINNKTITITRSTAGFGSKVYSKKDLADIERCERGQKCWLVGLAPLPRSNQLAYCNKRDCTPNGIGHQFSKEFKAKVAKLSTI